MSASVGPSSPGSTGICADATTTAGVGGVAGATPDASAHQDRRGPAMRPVLVEVAGCMEDTIARDLVQRLRRYRNRYQPLLRCVFTLVATSVPEARLFGDGDKDAAGAEGAGDGAHHAAPPLFTSPRHAVSVNKTFALVSRLCPPPPRLVCAAPLTRATTPCWADASAAAAVAEVAASGGCHERAVHRLEDFMAYHFLALAMTHNSPPPPPTPAPASAAPAFVLRHYVNEASRTASFLLVDLEHPCATATASAGVDAAIIDPRAEQVASYVADLHRFGATLRCIIFTHCYVDGASGLVELLQHSPGCRVVSGVPLAPAGTVDVVPLSSRLQLRAVRVPAFSPECLLVEICVDGVLAGLCSGVLWGTDAAPRWDLLRWSAIASSDGDGGGSDVTDRDAALAHTHAVLKKHLFDVYLAPLCAGGGVAKAGRTVASPEDGEPESEAVSRRATAHRDALQRVVLLPAHGGYSNVSHQLDLYWAAHLGDLVRMKHSRTVIDTIATTSHAFAKYCKRLPALPHPPLFHASRVTHLRQLMALLPPEELATCAAGLPADMQYALRHSFDPLAGDGAARLVRHGPPHTAASAFSSYVNLVDVRDAADYHARHLCGAVNVPMSFPGVAYGARRAELWLQCVLVPFQPILAVCAAETQRAEVLRRLSALSPESCVRVVTMADLVDAARETTGSSAMASASASLAPWREVCCAVPAHLLLDLPLPRELVWIERAGTPTRLTSYEQLIAIEPTNTRVVLDVRTPYEFKNGSHQHSVHVELAELCALAVQDVATVTAAAAPVRLLQPSPTPWRCGGSAALADAYMEAIHTTALLASLPVTRQASSLSDVVIYCAGGYRSLIAASLLQRAMEASATAAWRALRISDVSGGAFQIMTQRPDLWRVKDRSIICIS
ncbi:hypothetical protein NESM_000697100 [Novymonas esmeraldas]|uniref:Rhodanese domain-containing protein n=1 Tax=Novymonas esmeraldas TaxID=1808958 RepID=A0AAW0ET94_9TRYP